MKRTLIIATAFSLIFVSAEAKNKKEVAVVTPPAAPVFVNSVDSMSYALGVNVGTDFAKNIKKIPGGKSNIDLLIKGFATAMKGDSALMSTTLANEYFKNYMTKAQAKDTELKKAEGEKFLTENKTKAGVMTTASGLQYQILKDAQGPKPKATDSVKVHYKGTLVDGTQFDSSYDRGEPITFPLNQVIPGWTEGVQLMSVGSKYKLFVPYNLGYGERGAGGSIPGFAALIFEVELLAIKPTIEKPAEKATVAPKVDKKKVAAKPASAKSSKK
ncbi:MAG: FKBP-type peptidyl-prolyl cis-trans isomerase [Bacteroidales bacterium]